MKYLKSFYEDESLSLQIRVRYLARVVAWNLKIFSNDNKNKLIDFTYSYYEYFWTKHAQEIVNNSEIYKDIREIYYTIHREVPDYYSDKQAIDTFANAMSLTPQYEEIKSDYFYNPIFQAFLSQINRAKIKSYFEDLSLNLYLAGFGNKLSEANIYINKGKEIVNKLYGANSDIYLTFYSISTYETF